MKDKYSIYQLKRYDVQESINDQLITELQMVDQLMRDVGFSNGLETIKATAQELQNNPEAYMEEDES